MPTDTGNNIGLFLVNLLAGKEGLPGAPLLHLSLTVNAVSGTVTGQGKQTQPVTPPSGNIPIFDITGRVNKFTYIIRDVPCEIQVVALKGTAIIPFPPPAIGEQYLPFEAHFVVDAEWSGSGSWKIGAKDIKDVPIKEVTSYKAKN